MTPSFRARAEMCRPEVHELILEMTGEVAPANESPLEHRRRCAEQLNKHPNIATAYFAQRAEAFFTSVLGPLLHVRDYVIRYEFQQRGSPHCHCLLWVDLPRHDADSLAALRDQAAQHCISVFPGSS